MSEKNFVLKGDICYSQSPSSLNTAQDAYLVCRGGRSAGCFSALPAAYRSFPLVDYSGRLIIPGLVDLHVHAPQWGFRALGMDMELLGWLEKHAFPEEAKFAEAAYARRAYGAFVNELKKGPNTRACIFATVHGGAAAILMELLEEAGLACFVGKVNMDRNAPAYLCEAGEEESEKETRAWLDHYLKERQKGAYRNTRPILTPRFIPSCSDGLMRRLAKIQQEYSLPVQSHLSENRREIQWVKELRPESSGYCDAYLKHSLFGGPATPTIMAHCVWINGEETALIKKQGVFIAHCPQSNTNLLSGIAPVRRFLEAGVSMGLGSDVAGGVHTSIFRAMTDAVQVSKLRQALLAPEEKALNMEEAFWLGTAGGGAFFGLCAEAEAAEAAEGPAKTGSFEEGYDFDALVIDDSSLAAPFPLSLRDRLERVMYLSDDRNIAAKYVMGRQLV